MFNKQKLDKKNMSGATNLSSDKIGSARPKARLTIEKEVIQVRTMPSKFVAAASQHNGKPNSDSGSKSKKLILMAISLILIIIIVIAGIFYFTNKNLKVVNNDIQINQNANVNEIEDEIIDKNINENVNQNANVNEIEDEIIDKNINENVNQNANVNESIPKQRAFDADNDGLSYEEELVFGTNPELDDTDKDGYKDGQEIASLYNPLLPNKNLLQSGKVTKFINGAYNYSFLRPSSWLIDFSEGGTDKLIVLPDSETGETFSINVTKNINNETLVDVLSGMSDAVEYQNYNLAGVAAYRSIDNQKVLVINNNFIFIINHDVSSSGEINFAVIFEMMLNSFEWTNIEI